MYFYDYGAGLIEFGGGLPLEDTKAHTTTGGWVATEYPALEYTPTIATIDGLAWEAGNVLMPGKSEPFTFRSSSRPVEGGIRYASASSLNAHAYGALLQPGGVRVVITDRFGQDVKKTEGLKVAKWHDTFEGDVLGKVTIKGPSLLENHGGTVLGNHPAAAQFSRGL